MKNPACTVVESTLINAITHRSIRCNLRKTNFWHDIILHSSADDHRSWLICCKFLTRHHTALFADDHRSESTCKAELRHDIILHYLQTIIDQNICFFNDSFALQLDSEHQSTVYPPYSSIASKNQTISPVHSMISASGAAPSTNQTISSVHLIVRNRMQHFRHQKIVSASDDFSIKCSSDNQTILSVHLIFSKPNAPLLTSDNRQCIWWHQYQMQSWLFHQNQSSAFQSSTSPTSQQMIILNDHFMHVKRVKLAVIFSAFNQFFSQSIFFFPFSIRAQQTDNRWRELRKKLKTSKKKLQTMKKTKNQNENFMLEIKKSKWNFMQQMKFQSTMIWWNMKIFLWFSKWCQCRYNSIFNHMACDLHLSEHTA